MKELLVLALIGVDVHSFLICQDVLQLFCFIYNPSVTWEAKHL